MIKSYRDTVVANPRAALRSRVRSVVNNFSGRVGVSAKNLTTGEVFNLNEQTVFPTLSCIKLGILTELFFQAHEGRLRLDEKITIQKSDIRGGTGVLRDLTPPIQLTLRDIAVLMVTVSDNTCTWICSEKVGHPNVNKRMRSLGLKKIDLRSDLGPATFAKLDKADIDAYAVSSPADLTELISLIATGSIISKKSCEEVISILRMCQGVDYLGRYLPINEFIPESKIQPDALLANKIGAYLHGRADVGYIETKKVRYTITVMTDKSKDKSLILPAHEGTEAIGRISKAVYDAWTAPK
ncbi:MAG: serine hydrolase [SAR202 cluster bacterium]|nr:serine hydrolase [SAR202 cluster bacterium]